MCGIFALLDNNSSQDIPINDVKKNFMKGQHRGPEFSEYKNVMINAHFGFHRLAINGLNDGANQPIKLDNIVLICNGEIYNHTELYEMMNVEPTTDSDCEVIIHLYKQYGIEQALQMLDGVFAFCLLDMRMGSDVSKIYIARDPYGVRPLYIMQPTKHVLANGETRHTDKICIASEMKMIYDIYQKYHKNKSYSYTLQQFQPGTYSYVEMEHGLIPNWKIINNFVPYHSTGFTSCMQLSNTVNVDNIYKQIQHYLIRAVEKRCITTERPVACLLSGGLDSSLITALVNEYYKQNGKEELETYSIGIEGSDDLKYAKRVADYLGTKHTEIVLQEQDFLDAIPDVIYDIESYDTTTVRASIGNWLIGKYISEHSKAKVIFNGDGSDELTGGYLYVGSADSQIEFDKECRRLLKDIHTFDVLRSDKCISSHGLEPRTPFLDREWVQYYLSIPYHIRCKTRADCDFDETEFIEKQLLRDAFHIDQYQNADGEQLLPDYVLYRQKEAFSDGVSKQTRSLYQITQEHAEKYIREHIIKDMAFIEEGQIVDCNVITKLHPAFANKKNHLVPDTPEKVYYRFLFEKYYNGMGKIIPYFWMPKYIHSKDASARTLTVYQNQTDEEVDNHNTLENDIMFVLDEEFAAEQAENDQMEMEDQ